MTQVNLHEAKTHLSRLVDRAAKGESVVIAKAGKPLVRLVPVETREQMAKRRIGLMKGRITTPDDIKSPFADEIEEMFYGKP
jgi:prevent-host-death family protein